MLARKSAKPMKTLSTFLAFLCTCLIGFAETTADRPNIILIISDDHAFNDYGFMGSKTAKTPCIDRIASDSLVYTRGYVMPVCSPSLACLLTGKMPRHHGITGNDLSPKSPQYPGAKTNRKPLMDQLLGNSLILPKALSDSGYLTFQTGKLWNATFSDVGFTHGMTGKQGRHGGEGLTIGRKSMQPIYDFIGMSVREGKPFFIWHAPLMPHDPHTPPEKILEKYKGKGPTPAAEKYYAMVEWFDQTCGELDDYLTKNNLKKNTVILYLADNGWNAAEGYNGGRAKMTPYEMGIRSPMFVRWPGKTKPLRDDKTPAHITDFPTTILHIAGIKAPADLRGLNLLDRDAMTKRKSVFVESYSHDIADLKHPGKSLYARVVVDGFLKLIIPGPAKPERPFHTIPAEIELYNLKDDPLEKTNLAQSHPDDVKRLIAIQDAEWNGQ
jgi:arylsulfatase A-like enzyme